MIEISTHTFGERENVSNLTIIMADPSDAGGYVCMATNVVGQDTTAAELTVHGKCLSLTFCISANRSMTITVSSSHTQHHLPS